MAKILFANIPAHGHVNPTLPLVSAFVEAGHSVDYLITEDFRKKVEYCGAKLITYYQPVTIDLNNMTEGLKHIRRLIPEMNSRMKELSPQYDVIIAGGMNPSIEKLQKEISTPIIFCSAIFFQNDYTIRVLFTKARGIPEWIAFIAQHPFLRKAFSRVVASLILGTPIDDVKVLFSPQSSILNIAFTSTYFQPEAETFNDKCLFIGPTPTIAVKDDSFPIERLEQSSKKIIYATLGTIFNTWIAFFKNVIEAFKDSDYLVVMSTGNKERLRQIGDIPENFIVSDFVPQAEVLKHADLFIAHGSMGSISDGMYLGIPTILVPLGADQFFNAYRLQDLGAGKVLKKVEVTPENLKREAETVLGNNLYKQQVQKVQESFQTAGGPKLAVREVEKILEKKKVARI